MFYLHGSLVNLLGAEEQASVSLSSLKAPANATSSFLCATRVLPAPLLECVSNQDHTVLHIRVSTSEPEITDGCSEYCWYGRPKTCLLLRVQFGRSSKHVPGRHARVFFDACMYNFYLNVQPPMSHQWLAQQRTVVLNSKSDIVPVIVNQSSVSVNQSA